MMERSWFFRNGLFYTLLAVVLFIHFVLLLLHWKKNWYEASRPAPVEELKVTILRELPDAKKQIVQSDESDDTSLVEDAYLSDKNRSFNKQTRAARIAPFQSGGGGNPGKKSIKLSDLAIVAKGANPVAEAAKKIAQDGARGKSSRGVSSTNDYLLDVPLGDLTHLNTQEYKYYGYYHRIRVKLEQFWGRSIQEKARQLMRGGRRIVSDEELITSLIVVMDSEGDIQEVVIKGASGVKELDDAAVESFKEAGPFPNPPRDLIVDGRVRIEWGFVVKT